MKEETLKMKADILFNAKYKDRKVMLANGRTFKTIRWTLVNGLGDIERISIENGSETYDTNVNAVIGIQVIQEGRRLI